jgi:hypothetical protein
MSLKPRKGQKALPTQKHRDRTKYDRSTINREDFDRMIESLAAADVPKHARYVSCPHIHGAICPKCAKIVLDKA